MSTTTKSRAIRRLTPGLMARQAKAVEQLQLHGGVPWTARPGDWIITQGTELIDIIEARVFAERFAFLEDGLVLSRAICVRIEELTGIGTAQTTEKLVQAIDRLARITVGEVKIDFTPGQLEEISHRAAKRGYTVQQEVQRIVDRIKDELFYHS